MAYSREISRTYKACFVFLLDQSFSMTDPLGGSTEEKKDQLVLAINNWLQNMAIRATGDEGTKDWMDISVIGYRTDQQGNPIVESALVGPLAGRDLVSIVEIAENEARSEPRIETIVDPDTGEEFEMTTEVPVWVDVVAEGGTPMCHAMLKCHEVLSGWIADNPDSFPPIVIHITDGESQDGDPVPYSESVRALETSDGNVLLFNCHLSEVPAQPFMFPARPEVLPDELARVLYEMSSDLPESMAQSARAAGKTDLEDGAKGMAFNVDIVELIKFLDMGTRPATVLR
jgi:hypothetical protein